MKHFQELFDVDTEDLHLLIDAKYRDTESDAETKVLPKDEQYWELLVYGTDEEYLGRSDYDLSFSYEMEMDEIDTETFLDVVYPATVEMFEREYGGDAASIQYFDPENI